MSSPVLWYATRASGIAALVLLSATVVLGTLTAGRLSAGSLPRFARTELHRRLSMLCVAFVAVHVLTTVLDTYVSVGWAAIVLPFASHYHPFWLGLGTAGLDLLLAVGISSALRSRIPARAWRSVHWLAYLCWPLAVAHGLGMGTDAGLTWVVGLVAACIAAVVAAACWRTRSRLAQARPQARAGRRLIPISEGDR